MLGHGGGAHGLNDGARGERGGRARGEQGALSTLQQGQGDAEQDFGAFDEQGVPDAGSGLECVGEKVEKKETPTTITSLSPTLSLTSAGNAVANRHRNQSVASMEASTPAAASVAATLGTFF